MDDKPFPTRPNWLFIVAGLLTGLVANVPSVLHHSGWPWFAAIVLSVATYATIWGGLITFMRRWNRQHSLNRFPK